VRKVLPPHFAFIFVGAVASCCAQGSVRKVLPPYFSSAQVVLGCCVLILSRSDFRVFLTSFFCSWNPRGQSASLGPLLANFCCECRVNQCLFPVSIQLCAQGFPHLIHVAVLVSRSKSNCFWMLLLLLVILAFVLGLGSAAGVESAPGMRSALS
jgi:hypothetical protein